ncbi:FAD-dependent monooxygenase [Nonomuraea sp. NPDC048916]|uniref:FAD-dependent oxidoreductase n=1 Tax=Nonomuraea sp. NPDC048916 TaxID=3154232 RepID=UPI003408F6AA
MTEPGGPSMAVATCRPGDYFTWALEAPDPSGDPHVTLLGDAAHTMSPGRGDDANTALRDARPLTLTLAEVAAGRVPLGPAKAVYEQEMLRYGFAAGHASRRHPFARPDTRDGDATTSPPRH